MIESLADIKRHLQPGFTEQQTELLATCLYQSYEPLVTKREMADLRAVVAEVAESQKRLVAAQDRTEVQIEEVAAAQQRTEARMEEFTAAQARTEERMEEFAAAQARNEQRFEQFMASQSAIREDIEGLVRVTTEVVWGIGDLRKQVGGIAQSVGQGLEAYAMDRIPKLLEERFGFVTASAAPETLGLAGDAADIDVVYRGTHEARPVVVLCEVKTNISETEVREFLATVGRVRPSIDAADVRTLFFCYRTGEPVRRLIAEYGCLLAFPRGLQ